MVIKACGSTGWEEESVRVIEGCRKSQANTFSSFSSYFDLIDSREAD